MGCLLYFVIPQEPTFLWVFLPLILTISLVFIVHFYFPELIIIYRGIWAILLVFSGIFIAYIQTHHQPPFYQLPRRATIIQGIVQQVEILPSSKRRLTLTNINFMIPPESDERSWPRLLRVTLKDTDFQPIHSGDKIQIKTMLYLPPPPALPGAYDMQFHSWFSGIGGYGYALSPIQRIQIQQKKSLQNLRELIAYRIREVLPSDSGAIAQILLTGIGSQLSNNTRHDFAASGLAHLLAIAGLHLGIVMGCVIFITRWSLLRSEYIALYWPVKSISLILGLSAGIGYVVLTGTHLPALRSLLMALLIILALLFQRQAFSMHNLMLAALCLLIISPANVMNVSFQMSMAAVMGLIAGYQQLYQKFFPYHNDLPSWKGLLLRHIGGSGLVSLVAGLAVMPVVMAHFYEIEPYFILANLIAVPLTTFWVLPLGLASLLLMPFGLAFFPLKLMGCGIDILVFLAHQIAQWPLASLKIIAMPGWALVFYFLGLCILCLWQTKLRWIGGLIIGIGILIPRLVAGPDGIMSADGRMMGLQSNRKLWVACQGTCNQKILQQWQNYLNVQSVEILSDHLISSQANCTKEYCQFPQQHILIIRVPLPKNIDRSALCKNIKLELSFLWSQKTCKGIPVINKQLNAIEGAHLIYWEKMKITSDLEYRGQRLWVMEPIEKGRPNLPLAPSE